MDSKTNKQTKLIGIKRIDLWIPEARNGGGERELDEGGQKAQTSSYRINKHGGCNVQHDDSS